MYGEIISIAGQHSAVMATVALACFHLRSQRLGDLLRLARTRLALSVDPCLRIGGACQLV